jgi:large subunit ribosomal protein L7/L12
MSEKHGRLIEELRTMPILELARLVKGLEKVFGVAPVRVIKKVTEEVTEKTEFDFVITGVPAGNKIAAIKAVREALGLGLRDSKDFVDHLPRTLKEGISESEAEALREKFTVINCETEIK